MDISNNAISNIVLCSVPIKPLDQLTFDTRDEQKAFFERKAVKTFSNCNYTPRTGVIILRGYTEEFNTVNYGYYDNMYKGTTKRYYFWIVNKDFSAKDVTTITIQLDVFQTRYFDFNTTPCMIERGHVADDTIGANTLPENFECGDYVVTTRKSTSQLEDGVCYFLALAIQENSHGSIFGKIYSGFTLTYYDSDEASRNMLDDKIKDLQNKGKADAIAYIFTFPKFFADKIVNGISSGTEFSGVGSVLHDKFTFNSPKKSFSWCGDTYTPFNNKLLIYPYNFLEVTNPSGSNVILKFENFTSSMNIQEFSIDTVLGPTPTIYLTPSNYSGKDFSYDDSISCGGFGLCSWINDNFSNYFAQHQNSIKAQSQNALTSFNASSNVASNNYNTSLENADMQKQMSYVGAGMQAVHGVGNLLSLNFGGAFNSFANAGQSLYNANMSNQMANNSANNDLRNSNLMNSTNYQNSMRSLVASVQDSKVQPNTCKGDTTLSGLDLVRNTNTFFVNQMMIKPEYARIIDDYFQRYGYSINRTANPYIYMHTRKKWNYIKTLGCNITGNIPLEEKQLLEQMFDTGLTLWHSEDSMYKYNVKNEMIGD